jgi:hypothetical protein
MHIYTKLHTTQTNTKQSQSQHAQLNPCLFMLQITHAQWNCVKLCEMHVWKLMAMKLEYEITSHDMLT